ncbi:MAG: FAD-dependent oxidoreductase, partial [Lachnospiraceae bacterium]|nr:FAD-dependent oxidoreductase [Lachnospiraceae bacterium]
NHVPLGLFDFDKLPASVIGYPGSYTIPYRSYLVKDFDNLYVGGRCLSASKLGMATSRVMGTCAIGGQAIGTAAAIAVQDHVAIRDVDIHKVQQQLLKDDCYIPGVRNEDEKDLARNADVTASSAEKDFAPESVISGVSRTIDGENNEWRSEPLMPDSTGAWLQLALAAPARVSRVQVTFDSNFYIEKKITLSSRRQHQQKTGIPAELVKDYDVELLSGKEVVAVRQIRGNYQRLNRVNFETPVLCDAVRLKVFATNGILEARVFEVRVY